jgi:hypothetical protein
MFASAAKGRLNVHHIAVRSIYSASGHSKFTVFRAQSLSTPSALEASKRQDGDNTNREKVSRQSSYYIFIQST